MNFCFKSKDGGAESSVTGYWLIEWKSVFSIALLRFDGRSREAFHTHAFNCWTWVLKGKLVEYMMSGEVHHYAPSLWPFLTRRSDYHKVSSLVPRTWVLTVRGPWDDTWTEYLPDLGEEITLTHGRRELS